MPSPDLITGIHGDDPVRLYRDLCATVAEVIDHFENEGRRLPPPRVRPMHAPRIQDDHYVMRPGLLAARLAALSHPSPSLCVCR